MTPRAREMARTVVFLIVQVNSNMALSECTTPFETVMVSIRGLGWFMSDTIYEITILHTSNYSKYIIIKVLHYPPRHSYTSGWFLGKLDLKEKRLHSQMIGKVSNILM